MSTAAAPLVVAGRADELRRLTTLVARAAEGHGQAIALVGEAGIGKTHVSRAVLAEAARRDVPAVVGRCVPGAMIAYRPVREAVLSWSRMHGMPIDHDESPWLRGLRPLLEVPGTDGPEPVSPDFVAEAVLRLLGEPPRTALLVLEDLHWADAETQAVVEYLADHVAESGCGLVITLRPGELAPDDLVRRLHARAALSTLPLQPLSLTDASGWMHDRLGPVSQEVVVLVHERSGGNPLLLGEILDELAGTEPDQLLTRAASTLPASVRDSVRSKLQTLSRDTVQLLQVAALVGLDDLALTSAAAGQDDVRTRAAVAAGLEHGVLELDPLHDGRLQFRHDLVREAVLATAPAELRATAARRALGQLMPADPATMDDEDLLERIVELAGPAGASDVAARAALRGAVVAFDRWALASAERWLARARAHAGTDPALVNDIDLVQLAVSASAGRGAVVRRVGQALLTRVGPGDATSRLEVLLRLAQVAADVGDVDEARRLLDDAEPLLRVVDDPCSHTRHRLAAAIAAVAADERDLASRLAMQARVLAAPHPDQRDLECSSLVALGHARWPDIAGAMEAWQEALDLADAHGMRLWHGRLQVCRACSGVADLTGDDLLAEVRAVAREAGAPVLAARATALEAELALLRGQPDAVRRLLADARHHLIDVTPPVRLTASLTAIEDLLTVLEGGAADRTPAAVALADLLSGLPTSAIGEGTTTVEAAIADIVRLNGDAPAGRGLVRDGIGRVAHELRAGGAPATHALRDTVGVLSPAPWLAALLVLRVAPALLAGGPSADLRVLLREAITVLDDLPAAAGAADRARDLIRRAGAPYPRRPSAQVGVPETLRRQGITAREAQVLALVGEGLTNRQIADRLFLSPRTVEKHVERILSKTGAVNRAALAALWTSAGVT